MIGTSSPALSDSSSRPLTRRRMIQLLGGTVLATGAALAAADRASAGRVWCQQDPVVEIDGHVADVVIASYEEMNESATGATRIRVALPAGSEGSVLAVDNGFGGLGYEITFEASRSLQARVLISVYQPANDNQLPVVVDFVPRGAIAPMSAVSVTGRANKWLTFDAS